MKRFKLFLRKLWSGANIAYILSTTPLCFVAYLLMGLMYNDLDYWLFNYQEVSTLVIFILANVSVIFYTVVFIRNVVPDFREHWFEGWKKCETSKA